MVEGGIGMGGSLSPFVQLGARYKANLRALFLEIPGDCLGRSHLFWRLAVWLSLWRIRPGGAQAGILVVVGRVSGARQGVQEAQCESQGAGGKEGCTGFVYS